MSQLKPPKKPVPDWERVRDEWVRAVEALVSEVEGWCKANDWPTRRIEKRLEESRLGEYRAPALVFQVDFAKFMLEPVARFASASDGVLDLYLMPQYDNVAFVSRHPDGWRIHFTLTGEHMLPDLQSADPPVVAEHRMEPLTADAFLTFIRRVA